MVNVIFFVRKSGHATRGCLRFGDFAQVTQVAQQASVTQRDGAEIMHSSSLPTAQLNSTANTSGGIIVLKV